jgi:hypothetical protein
MAKGKTGDKNKQRSVKHYKKTKDGAQVHKDVDDCGEDYFGEENNWEAASSFACD